MNRIGDEWDRLSLVLSKSHSPETLAALRRVFYAGGWSMFMVLMEEVHKNLGDAVALDVALREVAQEMLAAREGGA